MQTISFSVNKMHVKKPNIFHTQKKVNCVVFVILCIYIISKGVETVYKIFENLFLKLKRVKEVNWVPKTINIIIRR